MNAYTCAAIIVVVICAAITFDNYTSDPRSDSYSLCAAGWKSHEEKIECANVIYGNQE